MKILAVVVTFNPNPAVLETLLNALQPQVDFIVVIDNNSSSEVQLPNIHNLMFITNSQNQGVAYAYNQGIALAQQQDASHVLLFDQDSCPAPDMVKHLKNAFIKYDNHQLAAVGPKYTDIKGQEKSPFVALRGLGLTRVECADNQQVDVDHLISSGCLLSRKAIEQIGLFEDQLFIDYVDTEWCWRAKRKGFRLLGVGAAKMQHDLGDTHFMAFGKPRVLHASFRLYYQMRNQWWMILQPWVGWRWRVMDIIRSIKIFAAISIYAPHRFEYIRHMSKGIYDAFRSNMGKLKTDQ
ncbi:glycosyltransferase family 2 protein [Cellvibrio japonicus]|uniref:glycosyltransferase family 2 protein n=1 Tax=Cellvibrio japonicus TaxID=155077 RepID=UPI0002E5448D|nr:glycosyltransferase family 2 protein [Cellvibrio japonicus]